LKEKRPLPQLKKDFLLFTIISLIFLSLIISVNLNVNSNNNGLDTTETPMNIFDTKFIPDVWNKSLDAAIDLPGIYIMSEKEILQARYITGFLTTENFTLLCNIKIRGHSVATLAKKGYRLEFREKVSLLGMRKDDDWFLFASYLDQTRMRTKLAFDLWRSLKVDNPTAILPNSRYVKLFINKAFQGIYLLAEKTDKKLFGLDDAQNNKNTSLIFKAKAPQLWEQAYPNEEDGFFVLNDIIIELTDFISNTSNDVFFNIENGIFSKFEKKNLIDFYLFNFFILHRDFWSHNYYLVRNSSPEKFFLIPWDFDACFGQLGWRVYNFTMIDTYYKNVLWYRLMRNNSFKIEIKERWKNLRENLWTEDFFISMLDEIYGDINVALEFEMNLWKPITIEGPVNGSWPDVFIYSNEEFNLEEKINSLEEWILNRLEICDSYFDIL